MKQRSPEWYEARRGHVTASKLTDITLDTKSRFTSENRGDSKNKNWCVIRDRDGEIVKDGFATKAKAEDVRKSLESDARGWGLTALRYCFDLVAERLAWPLHDTVPFSDDMQRGIDNEPQAYADAQTLIGALLNVVLLPAEGEFAFVEHPSEEWIGCSPDGIAGDKGLFEAKCPRLALHLLTQYIGMLPSYNRDQVQGQLWICERDWSAFASYHSQDPVTKLWLKTEPVSQDWQNGNVRKIVTFRDFVGQQTERFSGLA